MQVETLRYAVDFVKIPKFGKFIPNLPITVRFNTHRDAEEWIREMRKFDSEIKFKLRSL
jgi:hypothetical protein